MASRPQSNLDQPRDDQGAEGEERPDSQLQPHHDGSRRQEVKPEVDDVEQGHRKESISGSFSASFGNFTALPSVAVSASWVKESSASHKFTSPAPCPRMPPPRPPPPRPPPPKPVQQAAEKSGKPKLYPDLSVAFASGSNIPATEVSDDNSVSDTNASTDEIAPSAPVFDVDTDDGSSSSTYFTDCEENSDEQEDNVPDVSHNPTVVPDVAVAQPTTPDVTHAQAVVPSVFHPQGAGPAVDNAQDVAVAVGNAQVLAPAIANDQMVVPAAQVVDPAIAVPQVVGPAVGSAPLVFPAIGNAQGVGAPVAPAAAAVGTAPGANVARPAQRAPPTAASAPDAAATGASPTSRRGRSQPRRSCKRRSPYCVSEESISSDDENASFPSRISMRNKKPFQGLTKF